MSRNPSRLARPVEPSFALPYWNVTDHASVVPMEKLLGYRSRIHDCGDEEARKQCPDLLGGGATDCHCLPSEASVQALIERPCFGPLEDDRCFFAGVNHPHLAAHYLTGLSQFGFAFDSL